ncbi:hypothetical protein E2C01_017532 [Portunus trituberculatus]|uniref:Uncharacterized protein n=1 Tax=Portunus trituberculatus TaxID=210409 RepID=A0A5B7DS60_PORTR|nr:hypothetical protein [Portunus trituberculatus]
MHEDSGVNSSSIISCSTDREDMDFRKSESINHLINQSMLIAWRAAVVAGMVVVVVVVVVAVLAVVTCGSDTCVTTHLPTSHLPRVPFSAAHVLPFSPPQSLPTTPVTPSHSTPHLHVSIAQFTLLLRFIHISR